MILVTVGHKEFDRLIRAMDLIAKTSNEKIIMQIGYKPHFLPQNAEYFGFVKRKDMDDYFNRSEVIISHCSVSSILHARMHGKPLIVIPRLSCFGEAIDDHQTDFAKKIEHKNVSDIKVVYEIEGLKQAILEFQNFAAVPHNLHGPSEIIETIKKFVKSCDKIKSGTQTHA